MDRRAALFRKLKDCAEQSSEKGGFLPLAAVLREVRDNDPEGFVEACEKVGIKRRRGFALAKIDEVFGGRRVPEEQLARIGWSKLAQISSQVAKNPDRMFDLLGDAERLSSRELDVLLMSGEMLDRSHSVVLTFSSEDYAKFEAALIRFGAMRSGRGLAGKEKAVVAMIDALGMGEGKKKSA
jgi:hypothetical protein